MINRTKHQRGFTLLEVIITTLIASLLIGTITTFLVISVKSYNTNKDSVELQYQAQVTLNMMIDNIMYSEGVEVIAGTEELASNIGLRVALDKKSGSYGYYLLNEDSLYYIQDPPEETAIVPGMSRESEMLLLPRTLNDIWTKYALESKPKAYLIATHIKEMLFPPLPGMGELATVHITLRFEKGSIDLEVSNQVSARNYIPPTQGGKVNEEETNGPMDESTIGI